MERARPSSRRAASQSQERLAPPCSTATPGRPPLPNSWSYQAVARATRSVSPSTSSTPSARARGAK